jgi:hypothetical protein
MLFSKDRMMFGEQRVLIRTEHKPISRLFHALAFILYPTFFLFFVCHSQLTVIPLSDGFAHSFWGSNVAIVFI